MRIREGKNMNKSMGRMRIRVGKNKNKRREE